MSDRSELWLPALSRRSLLRISGVASLGAIVAACGDRGGDETPGRVGDAPVATNRPTSEVDDVLLLRTAQSLEFTAIEIYNTFAGADLVDAAFIDTFPAFVEDHEEHAALLGSLIDEAGGEQYACPNPWLMERAVGPIVDNIVGKPAEDGEPEIPGSDDPQRDVVSTAYAVENLAGSTYQALVAAFTEPELRAAVIGIAAQEVRHAAVIALLRTGAPKAYVSPVVAARETDTGATGTTALEEESSDGTATPYVITARYGELAAATLTIGAPNDAGVRFTATFETPAENSFIYEQMSCAAPSSTTMPATTVE